MNNHGFFKRIFRPACKPADAITKDDLRETERAIGTALIGFENRLNAALKTTQSRLTTMELTLEQLLAAVKEERTIANSLITLTNGIKSKLDAVLAGALTPEQQAKVNDVFAEVEAEKKEIADAITANTTPTPPV